VQEIVFITQKIVLRLLFPVGITLLLCIVGLACWRQRTWSFFLVCAGVVVLLALSFPLTGYRLVETIESKVPSYARPEDLVREGVRYVVVLSAGFREGDLTPADRLGSSVLRLIEGVRLWKAIPDARLVVTGGKTPGICYDMSIADGLAQMAMRMGVPQRAIIREDKSWTTEDQARLVKPIVGKAPFALVSSACHLPRSLVLFKLEGLRPIAAPCDFLAKKVYLDYETLVPQAYGLLLSQIAVKEYLALWWYLLKARFSGKLPASAFR
jgi:uncharacterized SAM-binding protein YcdF (DUF218 family)